MSCWMHCATKFDLKDELRLGGSSPRDTRNQGGILIDKTCWLLMNTRKSWRGSLKMH